MQVLYNIHPSLFEAIKAVNVESNGDVGVKPSRQLRAVVETSMLLTLLVPSKYIGATGLMLLYMTPLLHPMHGETYVPGVGSIEYSMRVMQVTATITM